MKKPWPRFFSEIVFFFCLVAAYFISGKLGLLLAFSYKSATLVWPPAGIALAAILLYGYRAVPAIFAAAFLVNITTQGSAPVCLGIASGNTVEAVLAAFLIRQFAHGSRVFERSLDILKFAMLAAVFSTAVGAMIGVSSLAIGGFTGGSSPGLIWSTWWLGDMMGILVVTPLVVLWGAKQPSGPHDRRKVAETLVLFFALLFVAAALFSDILPHEVKNYPLALISIPFMIWAVFRLSQREAVTAIFAISIIAVWGTLNGLGPFVQPTPSESLILLQGFMSVAVVIALTLVTAIFERKTAESALKQSSAQLQAVLDTVGEGILMVDVRGSILMTNREILRIWGYEQSELAGRPLSALFPDKYAEDHEKIFRDYRRTGIHRFSGQRMEWEGRRKDGSGFFLEILITETKIAGQTYFTASTRDITERKNREEELKSANRMLGQNNLELARRQKITLSLLEDLQESKENLEKQRQSLKDANTRLEELSSVKDEFVSTVSHELRTPLAVIKEGVELVLDEILGSLNAEQKDFLTTVDENIERLTQLINNILDLSKMEAGRIYLSRRRTRIAPLVRTVIQNCSVMIGKRSVAVEAAEDADVFADSERVLQVLQNLLANAIKFTPEDGTIIFSLKRGENALAVRVRDNGVGISKEDLPRLFQKFSQVGEGKSRAKGTGLGLALSKQLIELHRGGIDVVSEKNNGTTFTFTLPLYSCEVALEESFREEVEIASSRRKDEKIGMLAIDARPYLKKTQSPAREGGEYTEKNYELLVETMRKRLYMSSPIFYFKPHWVVILLPDFKDGKNSRSFLAPLCETLRELSGKEASGASAEEPPVGIAVYPDEGDSADELFRKAALAASPKAVS